MVLGFLRRLFKSKKTYNLNDEEFNQEADSVVFEKETGTTPKLLRTSGPLSPLMWRYIFPRSPSHPVDCEDDEQDIVSRHTYTRASTTSSAGYCSQTSDDSVPRLGATSMSGDSAELEVFSSKEASPMVEVRAKGYWGTPADSPIASSHRYRLPPCRESSPVSDTTSIVSTAIHSPAAVNDTPPPEPAVKRVEFTTLHAGKTPANKYNLVNSPATLPPKTPYRCDLKRLEVRFRKIISGHHEEENEVDLSEPTCTSFRDERTPTTCSDMQTPATLPPKTPYRGDVARNEVRPPRKPAISAPTLDLNLVEYEDETDCAPASDSSAVVEESIWGEPEYSPASSTELDTSHTLHSCTPYRALSRHDRISLRRRPSATVSGRVKQMVKFFENDSKRHEVPRRLDHLPPEFMRSCPQIDSTPSPTRALHEHTHSDRARGITSASARCIRCNVHNATPNSRRSMD